MHRLFVKKKKEREREKEGKEKIQNQKKKENYFLKNSLCTICYVFFLHQLIRLL